ncbi:Agrin [Dissostichus eleginoides]|uniref:Agrin n=1 Tax=Dissostichus eleginoides TaxID=100907 RepID=A0AAD9CDR1_DISEL|nr:Agrin [Dissostichus eleginoides]
MEWSMSGCHYPSPPPQEQERRYQHKVSLVVRYFMIPCNICLILLATSTLGFAVLLFLNNYKPPHFTPAQPPDGKSSVVYLRLPPLTACFLGLYLCIMNSDWPIPAFEVGRRLCPVSDLATALFCFHTVGMARGQVCSGL